MLIVWQEGSEEWKKGGKIKSKGFESPYDAANFVILLNLQEFETVGWESNHYRHFRDYCYDIAKQRMVNDGFNL
jgi:hypothetical protein